VSGAISWFFEQEPEGIVLEDDCVPHASFFPFCAELLKHYRDENRVSHHRCLEKPETTYHVSMGVYVYEPRVLRFVEREKI
jgi:hypothetical protein